MSRSQSKQGQGVQVLRNEEYMKNNETGIQCLGLQISLISCNSYPPCTQTLTGIYTSKIYLPGSFMPGWMKPLVSSSFKLEEEVRLSIFSLPFKRSSFHNCRSQAWNAFPFCKTVLTCSSFKKFSIEGCNFCKKKKRAKNK